MHTNLKHLDNVFKVLDMLEAKSSNNPFLGEGKKYPYTDIYTTGKDDTEVLHFEIALAGYKKEDISIEVKNGILIVESTHKEGFCDTDSEDGVDTTSVEETTKPVKSTKSTKSIDESETIYYQKHIAKRSFVSKYKLAEQFVNSIPEAEFTNGILKINIPANKVERKLVAIK